MGNYPDSPRVKHSSLSKFTINFLIIIFPLYIIFSDLFQIAATTTPVAKKFFWTMCVSLYFVFAPIFHVRRLLYVSPEFDKIWKKRLVNLAVIHAATWVMLLITFYSYFYQIRVDDRLSQTGYDALMGSVTGGMAAFWVGGLSHYRPNITCFKKGK